MDIFLSKYFILDTAYQSFFYSFTSAIIATTIGFFQAYIIHKKENSFFKSIFHFFILLHLSFSPSNIIYIYIEAFPLLNFNSPFLLGILLGFLWSPFPYLILRISLFFTSHEIYHLARTLGSSFYKNFFSITLPLLKPLFLGCFFFIFVLSQNEIHAPLRIGVHTFFVRLYQQWLVLNHFKVVFIFSFLFFILCSILFLPFLFFIKKKTSKKINHFKEKSKYDFIILFTFIPCLFIPFYFTLTWTFKNISKINIGNIQEYIFNSLLNSTVTCFLSFLFFLFFLYPQKFPQKMLSFFILPFFIPSFFIGIFLLFFQSPLSETPFPIILGQFFKFLPFIALPLYYQWLKYPLIYEELSSSLGNSYFKTFLKIRLPLFKNTFIVSCCFIFLQSIQELPITQILTPFGYEFLSQKIFTYSGVQRTQEASIFIFITFLISFFPIFKLAEIFEKTFFSIKGEEYASM